MQTGGQTPLDYVRQMLDRRRALVAQMREQDVGQFAAGAPAQRLQDRLVLAHGLAPALALAGEIGGVADAADAPGKARIGRASGRRCARPRRSSGG